MSQSFEPIGNNSDGTNSPRPEIALESDLERIAADLYIRLMARQHGFDIHEARSAAQHSFRQAEVFMEHLLVERRK